MVIFHRNTQQIFAAFTLSMNFVRAIEISYHTQVKESEEKKHGASKEERPEVRGDD